MSQICANINFIVYINIVSLLNNKFPSELKHFFSNEIPTKINRQKINFSNLNEYESKKGLSKEIEEKGIWIARYI